jgi:hypothetical protein
MNIFMLDPNKVGFGSNPSILITIFNEEDKLD